MNEKRYRETEARLFDDAGITPRETWLDLPRTAARTRVLEVGAGEPVVFLHGGPIAGSTWAYVAAHLRGVRAILVDRPGCGLSEPPPQVPGASELPSYVERLTEDLLDTLGLDRVLLVGSSLGGYSALRSASALPDRVAGVYLAGLPPFVPGWHQLPFFTMLRTPVLGALMVGLPAPRASVRLGLRQMGHERALRTGSIPAPMLDWERSWQRDTDTMRNDAAMIRRCGTFRGGFDPSLELTPADLDRVAVPVRLVAGTADPLGGAELGRRVVDLLPEASLETWAGAGHLPWYDDPAGLAQGISAFAGHREHGR